MVALSNTIEDMGENKAQRTNAPGCGQKHDLEDSAANTGQHDAFSLYNGT